MESHDLLCGLVLNDDVFTRKIFSINDNELQYKRNKFLGKLHFKKQLFPSINFSDTFLFEP